MARPRFGRLSKRDTMLERRSNDLHYALLSGKPPQFADDIEIPDAPKKRVAKLDGVPLEKSVQADIMDYLAWHPRVAWRIRINSGQFVDGDAYIKTFYGLPKDRLLSDIVGMLRGGRYFEIECKRPSWTKPATDRDRKQAARHEDVRSAGGIAFFAASLEDCKKQLNAALT